MDCEAPEAPLDWPLSKQGRHCCHKGGAPTEVRVFALCQPLRFLHLIKLCSRNTHPNPALLGQLSHISPFRLPPSSGLSSTALGFLLLPTLAHLFPPSGPLHLLFPRPGRLLPCSSRGHHPFRHRLLSQLCEGQQPRVLELLSPHTTLLISFTRFIITCSCPGLLLAELFCNCAHSILQDPRLSSSLLAAVSPVPLTVPHT